MVVLCDSLSIAFLTSQCHTYLLVMLPWRTMLPFALLAILVSCGFQDFKGLQHDVAGKLIYLFSACMVCLLHPSLATMFWTATATGCILFISVFSTLSDAVIVAKHAKQEQEQSNWNWLLVTIGALTFDHFSAAVTWGVWPVVNYAVYYWWKNVPDSPLLELEQPFLQIRTFTMWGFALSVGALALLISAPSSRRAVCWTLLLSSTPLLIIACHWQMTGSECLAPFRQELMSKHHLNFTDAQWRLVMQGMYSWRSMAVCSAIGAVAAAIAGLTTRDSPSHQPDTANARDPPTTNVVRGAFRNRDVVHHVPSFHRS